MGLFDFLKRKRVPTTYEEFVEDLLTNADPEALRRDKTAIGQFFKAMPAVEWRMTHLADICAKAAEKPLAEVNCAFVDKLLCDFPYIVTGDRDTTLSMPAETAALSAAIARLYTQGSAPMRKVLERTSLHLYNLPVSVFRDLYAIFMEDDAKRGEVLSHLPGASPFVHPREDGLFINGEGVMFPAFDYLMRHQMDLSPESADQIMTYLSKTHNRGNLAAYFSKIYLPAVQREGDEDAIAWFDGLIRSRQSK